MAVIGVFRVISIGLVRFSGAPRVVRAIDP
jgi:hypothetical protein